MNSWKKAIAWSVGTFATERSVSRLTEARIEAYTRQAFCRFGRICGICAPCVVERLKSGSEAEPESSERAEDDEWEGVANDPLQKRLS